MRAAGRLMHAFPSAQYSALPVHLLHHLQPVHSPGAGSKGG